MEELVFLKALKFKLNLNLNPYFHVEKYFFSSYVQNVKKKNNFSFWCLVYDCEIKNQTHTHTQKTLLPTSNPEKYDENDI